MINGELEIDYLFLAEFYEVDHFMVCLRYILYKLFCTNFALAEILSHRKFCLTGLIPGGGGRGGYSHIWAI